MEFLPDQWRSILPETAAAAAATAAATAPAPQTASAAATAAARPADPLFDSPLRRVCVWASHIYPGVGQ